ncbi:MAG TPA: Gfo/Idh/MocA family oxidoreductase, partial [Paenibacillus sp.]|nr:Gfo/Idh/MocA family oxidoreductase [Paenibacillus sp.]
WVCDPDIAQAQRLAEAHGIPRWTARLEDVLADGEVDWVDVTAPNRFHEDITVRSLEAGKHVLCQKPMADTAEAAARMTAAAERTGLQLGVYMCFRGDRGLRLLRRLIREGAFGGVISLRGRMISANGFALREGNWRMDGASGALDLLGVHMIDLFGWLHSDIEWVQAYSNTLYAPMKGDDVTTALYGLAGGVTAVLETTYCAFVRPGMPLYVLEVNGTAGTARYALETGRLSIQVESDFEEGTLLYKGGSAAEYTMAHAMEGGRALHEVHQSFVDALRSGVPFEIDGRAGHRAMVVMERTREAAAAQRRIDI